MRKKGFKYELGRYELSTSRYWHVSLFKKNRRKQVSNGFEGFYRKIRSLNLRISKVLAECGNEIYSLETFLITETCLDIARKEARFLEWFRVAPFFSPPLRGYFANFTATGYVSGPQYPGPIVLFIVAQ